MATPDELRNVLRAATSHIIKNNSPARARPPWGTALMAYAAGVLTIVSINFFARPMHPVVEAPITASSRIEPDNAHDPAATQELVTNSIPLPFALQLELAAAKASPEQAHELFKQAGDEYLASGDERNAARCYSSYLAKSKTPHSKREPDDTWLLAVLKLDRKENKQPHSEEIWK